MSEQRQTGCNMPQPHTICILVSRNRLLHVNDQWRSHIPSALCPKTGQVRLINMT